MTKSEFQNHLFKSSLLAFEFAKKYVNDELFINFKYDLILNASKDDDCSDKFDLYPEDNGIIKLSLSENEVVDILYRKDKSPVWIDINVSKSNKKSTICSFSCLDGLFFSLNVLITNMNFDFFRLLTKVGNLKLMGC